MAEEQAAGAEGEGGEKKPKLKIDPQTLVVFVNSALILATLGMLIYTKLIYHRPEIVEEEEIQKKKEELKTPAPVAEKVMLNFDQLTVNVAMTSGKQHYATLTFSVECRDNEVLEQVKRRKALFVDKVIAALGKRQITELNTIQGKLFLKSELLREFNKILKSDNANSIQGITDLYFSSFVLQ